MERSFSAAPFTFFRVSTADDQARRSLSCEPGGNCQAEALRSACDDRDGGSVPQKIVITHASSPRSWDTHRKGGFRF